jgi:sorting nexin-8
MSFFDILELPIPTLDSINELEDRLIRLLRSDQGKNALCFRYGDLCSLDTIQIDVAPEKKGASFILPQTKINYVIFSGVILRHFEYEVSSMVNIFLLLLLLYVILLLFVLYQRHKNKVSRRYNDFIALHEILSLKYSFRIIPQLPPKKAVNGLSFIFLQLGCYFQKSRVALADCF